MSEQPVILFTAFEPSGDALAAVLIAAVKQRQPERRIYALGGPRMAAAGAQVLETTTGQAVMLAGAARQALVHRARVKRLGKWMAGQRLAAVVPTDSPAANWSICALTRKRAPEAKIVHLAAPQLWAWGQWRIGKLRRLTDRVLCLLPFEPAWFAQRGLAATFVGHPLFERRGAARASAQGVEPAATDALKLALLPGSRDAEVRANWPSMLAAAQGMRRTDQRLAVTVSAADRARAELVRSLCPGGRLPEWMRMVEADADAVLDWTDIVLVVSGTATLQCAAHGTPMVVLYRIGWWSWHLAGRWLVRTRTFTLPNLIGQWLGLEPVVPELVPYFGDARQVERAVADLAGDEAARQRQRAGFSRIVSAFEQQRFSEAAAEALLEML